MSPTGGGPRSGGRSLVTKVPQDRATVKGLPGQRPDFPSTSMVD